MLFRFFLIPEKFEYRISHERAYKVDVYIAKQSRKGHYIFFLTDYIQSNFALTLACLDNI